MKRRRYALVIALIAIVSIMSSCKSNNTSEAVETRSPVSGDQRDTVANPTAANNGKKSVVHTATLTFIDYNDDGDYRLLNARKGRELWRFINDKNDRRDLLRGDLVEITWKQDTIYIAGEGERPELADWLISIKKIKDGNVSNFRKAYNKPLKYYWSEEDDFSTGFKDKLYSFVEYYLANTNNELVKLSLQNKTDLVYSIEKQERNGREYIVLGISNDVKGHTSIIQWLFYDPETDKLYVYDLPNDKLAEFN